MPIAGLFRKVLLSRGLSARMHFEICPFGDSQLKSKSPSPDGYREKKLTAMAEWGFITGVGLVKE